MRKLRNWRGFTLVELLVVIAIIALLISILLPSLSRARELSKRLVCAANIKGVGTSAKIYANDNAEQWMIPGHKSNQISANATIAFISGSVYNASTGTYNNRNQESKKEGANGSGGSTAVSVTRSFWMLVRSGDVTVKQWICPSSGDVEDGTQNIDLFYDFTSYNNCSYGYQVPFGPRDTRAREGMDNRQAAAADKGPFWSKPGFNPQWSTAGENGQAITLNDSPKTWRQFNSNNHGGSQNGEGQNVLFADGHASFQRLPAIGVDNDNIYTLMLNSWNALPNNRIHGEQPEQAAPDPYPGQNAFGNTAADYASTDSLIYP